MTGRRIVRIVWIGAGLTFTAWMACGFQATGLPSDVLRSDQSVIVVEGDDSIDFRGLRDPKPAGVIFLPGGLVDPLAYAPLMRQMAKAGYRARLLRLPMRCACTNDQIAALFDKIKAVVEASPDVDWVLAGHSRGGMLAARYMHERGAGPAGLVLIGTTHPRDFSLSALKIPVMKIYGTRDGAPYTAISENADLVPAGAIWRPIEGGNQVQFGFYRHQLGDDSATISRDEQQKALARALREAIEGAGRGASQAAKSPVSLWMGR